MSDPTYRTDLINQNPVWKLAHLLSELLNDQAPIGWGRYIGTAKCLLDAYDMQPKKRGNT